MSYVVKITNKATGETRDRLVQSDWGYLEEYMWTGGNYGCDCNRAMFFAEAGDEEDCDISCGTDAYSARAVLPDGQIIELAG